MPELLDASEQIRLFGEFIEKHYYAQLREHIRKGEHFLIIDFADLSKFNPSLADILLDDPEEAIKAMEIGIKQLDAYLQNNTFAIRIRNLPEVTHLFIRNIRSKHLQKLFTFTGVIRRKSGVKPQVTTARFECPSCGNTLAVLQLDANKKFKEPSRCSCGRKGKFRLLHKELVDAQSVVIEEAPEDLDGGDQPKRINVFLTNDLVSPLSERRTSPGTKVSIVGVIKEVPIILRSGVQSTVFDLLIEANYMTPVEENYADLNISKEEFDEIQELAKNPNVQNKIISAIAPSIYGHDRIKESLVLQSLGGVRKIRDDNSITRGDIHILLIGDPGAGKSMMLKRIADVAPKGRFISGKGVSGAGLTAAVVKDELLGGWSLEGGALVLAHKGTCCIDELDKMTSDDRAAMHEALEGQSITISKANVQATLRCETTVLAAANPKFGRFDPYDTIANQIDLPPTLINRFDLIFPIKDLPDVTKDEKMASFVLKLHKGESVKKTEDHIETNLLRKYFAYAKRNMFPKLSDEAIEELKNYYVQMRNSGNQKSGIKSIPISARQLEGLVRLSEGYAKIRLSTVVTAEDAKKAISILDYCLRQVALDEETGLIDIDRIATDMPSSKRNKLILLKELIADLEKIVGKEISIEEIIANAKEKGMKDAEIEEIIQKLKRSGDLYEPKRGFISRI
jgi:replicative DNA helicase Mcm